MTMLIEFEINGLAGRRQPIHFTLNADVNIFFGLNGTGKTSLLKILHSALADDPRGLLRVPFESARIVFFSSSYGKNVERSIVRKELMSTKRGANYSQEILRRVAESQLTLTGGSIPDELMLEHAQFGGWITKPSNTDLKGMRHIYLPTSRLVSDFPAYRMHSSGEITEHELDKYFAQQIQLIWRRYANRLLSEIRGIQEEGLAEILRSALFPPSPKEAAAILTADVAFDRANHFLKRQGSDLGARSFNDFSQVYHKDPKIRSMVRDIDAIERKIERAEEPRQRLIDLIAQFVGDSKQFVFNDEEIQVNAPSGTIPLEALSSGEKQLMRIFVDVIGIENNTIMIDEPELSMHIDWQSSLVQGMQMVNPEAQIIMATHSPEIMGDVSDEKIFRL